MDFRRVLCNRWRILVWKQMVMLPHSSVSKREKGAGEIDGITHTVKDGSGVIVPYGRDAQRNEYLENSGPEAVHNIFSCRSYGQRCAEDKAGISSKEEHFNGRTPE